MSVVQKESQTGETKHAHAERPDGLGTAFGYPRDFLDNRFVYVVISPRARGLSVGVNMNPDRRCNFDCLYCEVNRATPPRETELDVELMARELQNTLGQVQPMRLRKRLAYAGIPDELLQLRHVTLSGDGEPTLCPRFVEAVHAVVHVRALGGVPFFKIVLITNSTCLDSQLVQQGLRFFTQEDEVWVKLDAGTQGYMDKINRPEVMLDRVLDNILFLSRQRPVIIQSLFPMIDGQEPPEAEVEAYTSHLQRIKEGGGQISLVQIYSATRPTSHSGISHLPLKTLSRIAHSVRRATGLQVEVF